MDSYYIFDNTLKISAAAVKDGRLETAIRNAAPPDEDLDTLNVSDFFSDTFTSVMQKIFYLDISLVVSAEEGWYDVDFTDTETYLCDQTKDFLKNIESFAKGGLSFTSGLINDLERYNYVNGVLVDTYLYPEDTIYVVLDKKTGAFVGTVGQAFISTIDTDKYILYTAHSGEMSKGEIVKEEEKE